MTKKQWSAVLACGGKASAASAGLAAPMAATSAASEAAGSACVSLEAVESSCGVKTDVLRGLEAKHTESIDGTLHQNVQA